MDTYKWSASADLGLGLSRSFGNIFTSLLLTNGEGYKGVASEDSNEKISFQAVYGQKRLDKKDGFNLGVVFSMLPYELEDGLVDDEGKYTTDPTSKTSQVFGFFGGFSGYGARIGFDFNQGSNLGIDGHGESSLLNSIYLNYDLSFLKGLSLITRYDAIDRGVEDDLLTVSEDESINDNENKILIGLIYKCSDEGWALSPNLVMNKEGDQESIMNFNLDFQFRF